MPQLIENKQSNPVLIANFEPNEIATKSAQKTKIQTRKHCADEPAQEVGMQMRKHCAGNAAQKVENRELVLRLYGRGLFEGDLPGAVSAEAEAGAAVIVGKSTAVEGARALQAVEDDGGVIAEHFNLKLGPSGVVEFVAGREDDSQNGCAVEGLAVGRDVNVFGSHEAVHGGAIVFEPRGVPGFAELFDLLVYRRRFHKASIEYGQRDYMNEFRRTQEKKKQVSACLPASLVAEKPSSLGMTTLKKQKQNQRRNEARRRPEGRRYKDQQRVNFPTLCCKTQRLDLCRPCYKISPPK